jgi:hypothetical protein
MKGAWNLYGALWVHIRVLWISSRGRYMQLIYFGLFIYLKPQVFTYENNRHAMKDWKPLSLTMWVAQTLISACGWSTLPYGKLSEKLHAKFPPIPSFMDRTSNWKQVMMKRIAEVKEVWATMASSYYEVSPIDYPQGEFNRNYVNNDDRLRDSCM